MISHGIVSGALFLCVGVVYDRMHTREIAAYGGLVNRMPLYAVVFMVFTMANVGLPGTSGFVGEFLTLIGAFQVNTWVALLATHRRDPVGLLRAVALSQGDLRRAGEAGARRHRATSSRREIVDPRAAGRPDHPVRRLSRSPMLDMSAASVAQLIENYQQAVGAEEGRRARSGEMNALMPHSPRSLPALPEIVLAVGAMALLMFGAFSGEKRDAGRQSGVGRAADRSRR